MAAGPNYGSPLYVFTDASATKENIDEVLLWAEEMGITIYQPLCNWSLWNVDI